MREIKRQIEKHLCLDDKGKIKLVPEWACLSAGLVTLIWLLVY